MKSRLAVLSFIEESFAQAFERTGSECEGGAARTCCNLEEVYLVRGRASKTQGPLSDERNQERKDLKQRGKLERKKDNKRATINDKNRNMTCKKTPG